MIFVKNRHKRLAFRVSSCVFYR